MILGGLLTVRQVADELGISPRAVHHRIERGEIKAEKVGDGLRSPLLITRAEVDRIRSESPAAS